MSQTTERIHELVDKRSRYRHEYYNEDAPSVSDAADEKELECVVAKRADSFYSPGRRTKDWIKFKRMADEEFVVCGYIRKSANTFSIILGKYHNLL